MLNKLIFANLTHRPVRTLLSVLAIAVEVTMILTLVGVSYGTLDSNRDRARGIGADIIVRPPNSQVIGTLSSSPFSEKYVGLLMQQPHVALATGTVALGIGGFDSITGIDFPAFNKMSNGFTYASGGDPVNDDDMVVDDYFARQKHLQVGSKVTLASHDWRISGIFTGDGKLTRIGVKLPVLQAMNGTPGHLTVIYVKLDDPKYAQQIVDQLKVTLHDDQIYTMDALTSMFSINNVPMLKDFTYVVIVVAVIVGFIVVFMAMYTAVLERTREIGIIKAVGGSSGLVLSILLRETFLLALLGTGVGIILTYGAQALMKYYPVNLVQETVYDWWLYAGVIAIVGATLGAIVPGYKAVQQDVTEALSYE